MSDSSSDDSSRSPKSYRPTENLAQELSLSRGEVLRARVVSKLPRDPGKLVITVRGHRVLAESQLDVSEDQVLLVRVKSLQSPIELELIDPYDAPGELREADLRSFLERTELPSSDDDLDVLREWLDQSLPLDRSLLEDVLDDKSLVQDQENAPDGNRLWASAFLHDRNITGTESLVSALSKAREADPGRDLTLFYRTNEGGFQSIESGTDLREALQGVGFDLVRQMSRRPHRAAKTLHAQLLKDREDPKSSSSRALPERLLGLILGVALSNLRVGNEFLVFLPVTGEGAVNLAWLKGRVGDPPESSWSVRGQIKLSSGPIEFSAERKNEDLNVSIRTLDEETIELLKERRMELRSKFMNHYQNVRVSILEEAPDEEFNPFTSRSMSSEKSSGAFTPGVDLTV